MDEVQTRQGHWAIVDLIGKGGHIRTVPILQWTKQALDLWTAAAGITDGRMFSRCQQEKQGMGPGHLSKCGVVRGKPEAFRNAVASGAQFA